jgi:phosphoglycolate phosphatase-like HAD superfamily hydrolase
MAADALIFDLDGTVWDSWPWYASLIGGEDEERRADVLDNLRRGRPIAKLLRAAGIREAHFRRLCGGPFHCALYSGVRETLADLSEDGVPLAAVTNLPDWIAGPMLDALQLRECFSAYVHYGSTPHHKPSPAPLLRALEELKVAPGPDAWYVGDTTTDARASEAAGVSYAWAAYGYGSDDVESDAVIDRFEQVAGL